MTSSVLLSVDDGVATITLNRPRSFNTVNKVMAERLRSVVHELTSNNEVHCIAIQSTGADFSRGIDLSELNLLRQSQSASGMSLYVWYFMRDFVEAVYSLKRADKPVLVAAQGVTCGAGLALLLAGDVRIATNNSTYNLGCKTTGLPLIGSVIPQLREALGAQRIIDLAISGEDISAADMQRAGMARILPPKSDPKNALHTLAVEAIKNWNYGCRDVKRALSAQFFARPQSAFEIELNALSEYVATEEFWGKLEVITKNYMEKFPT